MTFVGCLTPLTVFWYLLPHVVSGRARSLKDVMTEVFTFSKLSNSFSYLCISSCKQIDQQGLIYS